MTPEDHGVTLSGGQGGWFTIHNPLTGESERVQGKDDAEARYGALVAQVLANRVTPSSSLPAQESPAGDDTMVGAPREYTGKLDKKAQAKYKTIRIILDESDEIPPSGLFIGLNGRGYMLKPNVEIDVPEPLIGILDTAVMAAPVVDDNKRVTGYRNRRRYSYRRV